MPANTQVDLLVLGAGASGQMAALEAARQARSQGKNLHIQILEAGDTPGRKILASGNGRCNLANRQIQVDDYMTSDPRLLERFLSLWQTQVNESFFEGLGLALTSDAAGRLYPLAEEALAVQAILSAQLARFGVDIAYGQEVTAIRDRKTHVEVVTQTGQVRTCRKLILAAGSKAAPELGGHAFTETFARAWRIPYQEQRPALSQLLLQEKNFLRRAKGARFKGLVTVDPNLQVKGEYLINRHALSGIAAMDLSSLIGDQPGHFAPPAAGGDFLFDRPLTIRCNLVPSLTLQELQTYLEKKLQLFPEADNVFLLTTLVKTPLAKALLGEHRVSEKGLERTQLLARLLHACELHVRGIRSFTFAQTSRGGILLSAVQDDLSLKTCPNLYVTGECLDVCGRCGGYNLYFAFASGAWAGRSAVRSWS